MSANCFASIVTVLLFASPALSLGKHPSSSAMTTATTTELKPSIYFGDLQLKPLCEEEEWLPQFESIRSRWTKCIGFRRVYLRTELPQPIDDKLERQLRFFLVTSDSSLNAYCRLYHSWAACSHHLREMSCFVADYDTIQRAKDPKYTPLHRTKTTDKKHSKHKHGQSHKHDPDDDDIGQMAELYQIRCETVKLTHHYMPSIMGGGAGGLFNPYDYGLDEYDDQISVNDEL